MQINLITTEECNINTICKINKIPYAVLRMQTSPMAIIINLTPKILIKNELKDKEMDLIDSYRETQNDKKDKLKYE